MKIRQKAELSAFKKKEQEGHSEHSMTSCKHYMSGFEKHFMQKIGQILAQNWLSVLEKRPSFKHFSAQITHTHTHM